MPSNIDPLPLILGNPDIKEVLLYAMCRYDQREPKNIIPIVLVGKSGEGKTAILECINAIYPAQIFPKDGLSQASLSELKMSRKALLIDEMSKWSINYLGAVVTLFSHGDTERARKYGQSKVKANGLPIGTLLDTWQQQEGDVRGIETKSFMIAQILRRSVILYVTPTTRDPALHKQYIHSIINDIFGLEEETDLLLEEFKRKVAYVIKRATSYASARPVIEESAKVENYLSGFRDRIVIDKMVNYDQEMPKLVTNLAVGRAFAFDRKKVLLSDFERVGDIIIRHSKELEMWINRPSGQGEVDPSSPRTLPEHPSPQEGCRESQSDQSFSLFDGKEAPARGPSEP